MHLQVVTISAGHDLATIWKSRIFVAEAKKKLVEPKTESYQRKLEITTAPSGAVVISGFRWFVKLRTPHLRPQAHISGASLVVRAELGTSQEGREHLTIDVAHVHVDAELDYLLEAGLATAERHLDQVHTRILSAAVVLQGLERLAHGVFLSWCLVGAQNCQCLGARLYLELASLLVLFPLCIGGGAFPFECQFRCRSFHICQFLHSCQCRLGPSPPRWLCHS